MSNTSERLIARHIKAMGNVFDFALTADSAMCYKPDLRFFGTAERVFSLREREHVHVAKGYWWDIVPAYKMSWKKIWVNRDGLPAGRENEQPYRIISSLSELPDLL